MSLMPSRGAAGAAGQAPDFLPPLRTDLPRVGAELSFSNVLMGLNPIKNLPREAAPVPVSPERFTPAKPQGAGHPSSAPQAHAATPDTGHPSGMAGSPPPQHQPHAAPSQPGTTAKDTEPGQMASQARRAANKSPSQKATGAAKGPADSAQASAMAHASHAHRSQGDSASGEDSARIERNTDNAAAHDGAADNAIQLPLNHCGLTIAQEFQAWRPLLPTSPDPASRPATAEATSGRTADANALAGPGASARRDSGPLAGWAGIAGATNTPSAALLAASPDHSHPSQAHLAAASPVAEAVVAKTDASGLDADPAESKGRIHAEGISPLPQMPATLDTRNDTSEADGGKGIDALAASLAALLGRSDAARQLTPGALARQDDKPQAGPTTAALGALGPQEPRAESPSNSLDAMANAPGVQHLSGTAADSSTFQALLGAQAANQSPAADAADEVGPRLLNLPTPLNSPDFASDMSARLSLLASEGVQEARLHLNPAEMGPVSVQILVDGQQAQIHFQADVAQTREVLQNSLPELAAALRDNGLTLSGGGVSSQSQGTGQQGDRGQDNGRQSSRGGLDTAGSIELNTPPQVMRRASQGVLDLFA